MNNPNPLPLAVAVCDGDIQRVGALLDDNEPINKRDYKGRTALVLALLSREREIARLLLERGADTNLHDAKGRYPLHLSLQLPDVEMAGLILDRGARPDMVDRKERSPLHLAAACGSAPLSSRLMKQLVPLNARDSNGATPLHHAAANNRPAAVQALLHGEPDLEVLNGKMRTPLWVAVDSSAHGVMELLLAAGANPQANMWRDGTPLDRAYQKEDYEAVEMMEGPGTRDRIEADLAAATEHLIPEAYCEGLELRLETLRKSIGPITNEPRFNVNRFLEVFDKVRPKPGFVLDYYHDHLDSDLAPRLRRRRCGDPDAKPLIFTRPESQSHDEAANIARDLYLHRPHLMKNLEFERSPEGLLQWIIFRTAATQFHLCWHANYNDLEFIISHAGLERVLEPLPLTRTKPQPLERLSLEQFTRGAPLEEPDRDKLRTLDLTPWVELAGDLGQVRVMTFTKWGGFAFRHHHLRRPHNVDCIYTETVVEYNCGIRY